MNRDARQCKFCGETLEWADFRRLEPQMGRVVKGMRLAVKLMDDAQLSEACGGCWDKLVAQMTQDEILGLVVELRDDAHAYADDLDTTEDRMKALQKEHDECASEWDIEGKIGEAVRRREEELTATHRKHEQELECQISTARDQGFRAGKEQEANNCRFRRGH